MTILLISPLENIRSSAEEKIDPTIKQAQSRFFSRKTYRPLSMGLLDHNDNIQNLK